VGAISTHVTATISAAGSLRMAFPPHGLTFRADIN
jgi:hypothetical protein